MPARAVSRTSYNAMSPLTHRAPGVVGAALDSGALWCGLIADGHHVHPAAIGIALRAKRQPGRIFLVTDAMSTVGSDQQDHRAQRPHRLAPGRRAGAGGRHAGRLRPRHDVGRPLPGYGRLASISTRRCAWPRPIRRHSSALRSRTPAGRRARRLVYIDDDAYRRGEFGVPALSSGSWCAASSTDLMPAVVVTSRAYSAGRSSPPMNTFGLRWVMPLGASLERREMDLAAPVSLTRARRCGG